MPEVNTLPWFWQALSFLSCWGAEKTRESWAERQGAALLSLEERVDWKETTAATSPAAQWLYALPLCPGTNSPGEPASLLHIQVNLNVLEHWNDYQVAHLRRLQEPREVNPAGERLGARPPHWPPGGPGKPTQRRARFPEKATQPQSPDIWALTLRRRHGVSRQRPGQACTRVSTSQRTRNSQG